MSWWKRAICDTCSLLTVHALLSNDSAFQRHFPTTMLALERSFSVDQMCEKTASRIRSRVTIQPLPPNSDLKKLATVQRRLPLKLPEIDLLVLATALHYKLPVLTNCQQTARELRRKRLHAEDIASVLRELATSKRISHRNCQKALIALVKSNHLLLRTPLPTWELLSKHRFPH